MLQEAYGSSGHPSYRRYHYGEGPLLVEDGGVRRFISTDALGSTTDLTTTGATVASMRKYDAWGQYRNDTAPSAAEPKLGFTGHQYDPETGLVYARARYYDPDLGRFISRDSYEGDIGNAPSLHRYTYGHGNPTRYTDQDGHAAAEDISAQAAQEAAEEAARRAAAEAAKRAAEGAAANMPMAVQPSMLSRLLAVGAKVVRVGGVLIQIAWPERTAVYECENSPGGCVGPATRPGDAVATTQVRLPQAGPTLPGGKEHRIKQDDGVSPVQGGPVAQGDSGNGGDAAAEPVSGDTQSAKTGKEFHKRRADERRAAREAEGWSTVNEKLVDAAGEPVRVERRVNPSTGVPVASGGTQTASPDATSFTRRQIHDDKPLGRPLSKDRQELIRYLKAYESATGEPARVITIERYDPVTKQPVRTDIVDPDEVLPGPGQTGSGGAR